MYIMYTSQLCITHRKSECQNTNFSCCEDDLYHFTVLKIISADLQIDDKQYLLTENVPSPKIIFKCLQLAMRKQKIDLTQFTILLN